MNRPKAGMENMTGNQASTMVDLVRIEPKTLAESRPVRGMESRLQPALHPLFYAG